MVVVGLGVAVATGDGLGAGVTTATETAAVGALGDVTALEVGAAGVDRHAPARSVSAERAPARAQARSALLCLAICCCPMMAGMALEAQTTGAGVVATTLRRLGAEVVFSLSGNQIMALYDVMGDAGLRVVHTRHETGAATMAEAWGRLREAPGVCLLTAGPGHTSALTGVYNARAAETPLLVLSGCSPLGQQGRGAFQEMDQVALARPLCKGSWRVESADDLAPSLARAWHLAAAVPPGPVHLSLPVDLLEAPAPAGPPRAAPLPGAVEAGLAPDPAQVRHVAHLLAGARRPVALLRPPLGRTSWRPLVERLDWRLLTLVAESPRGLGDPRWGARAQRLREADAVLLLARRDFAVGFGRLPGSPPLAQVSSQASELEGLEEPDVGIHADERAFLEALLPLLEESLPLIDRPLPAAPEDDGGEPMHPVAICATLEPHLRPDDLLVIDGGEVGQWMRAGFRHLPNEQLINGKSGAIGTSIPHAVGAALAAPGRRVFAFVGDGAFGYYAAELDTAAREGLGLVVIVGNDSRWSAEWHIQAQRYGPERTFSTNLQPRPYELVAQGYGARAVAARTRAELQRHLAELLADPVPPPTVVNVTMRSLPSPAAG